MQGILNTLMAGFIAMQGLCAFSQENDSILLLEAVICDQDRIPLPATTVIDITSGHYSVCDSSGRFLLHAYRGDSLIIRNLSCVNKIMQAEQVLMMDTVILKTRIYALKEIRVFDWGSTYADMKNKMKSLPTEQTTGEKLGLPVQKGNPVPNYRNENFLKNPLAAYTNPVDFLYYNLSKKEKSVRKVMEFKRNEDKFRNFENVYNRENVAAITALTGTRLDSFMVFLNLNFRCDMNCPEFEIRNEIYRVWNLYRQNPENGIKTDSIK